MIAKKVIKEPSLKSFPIKDLVTGTYLPFDVYIKDRGILIHYLSKGALYTVSAKEELQKRGIKEGFVHSKYEDLLSEYLETRLSLKPLNLDDPLVFQRYCLTKAQHLQIDPLILNSDIELPFDLFVTDKFLLKPFLKAGDRPSEKLKDTAELEGDLLIQAKDSSLYLDYLNKVYRHSKQEGHKGELRFVLLKEETKKTLREFFEEPSQQKHLRHLTEATIGIVESVMNNREIVYEGLSHRCKDYYTYTHSLNVMLLSVRLALELGLNKQDIERLAVGTILHDIGHIVIAPEIVNKQGRLNSAEYKIIRMHVTEGEKILRQHKGLHEDSYIPLLQHHEKLTGNGYPFRLSGKEIKLFGRITAIADCYDALTTHRPFRVANTPFFALSILAKEKKDFDNAILKVFIKMLGGGR